MFLVLHCNTNCTAGGIAAQVVAGAALNTRPGSPSRLIVLAARVIIRLAIIIITNIIIHHHHHHHYNHHHNNENLYSSDPRSNFANPAPWQICNFEYIACATRCYFLAFVGAGVHCFLSRNYIVILKAL